MSRLDEQIKDKHALIHYKNIPKLSRINKPYKLSEIFDIASVFTPPHKLTQ